MYYNKQVTIYPNKSFWFKLKGMLDFDQHSRKKFLVIPLKYLTTKMSKSLSK